MTVVAWDGHTLAADKQAEAAGYKFSVTKIEKHNGHLLFSSGGYDVLKELFHWYKTGADPEKWPEVQKDKEEWGVLMVVTPEKQIIRYERRPYPFAVEEKFFSVGSGRDYALAAMHLGCTAEKAVEVACKFSPSCGLGIDVLTLADED